MRVHRNCCGLDVHKKIIAACRATTYQDLGPDYFDKRNTVRATHRLVKRLEALGHRVILELSFIADPSSKENFLGRIF